jgi:signal transduction histidine kinase
MSTQPVTKITMPAQYSIPLFLALIAGGLAGNYFKFSIFLNLDFIFGSIFAMLALQLFGAGPGIAAAAIIGGYTYVLWNHPYAIIIMTAEVAIVAWLMERRRMRLLVADTIYWLVIGMPLVYLFYHLSMHVPLNNSNITMIKQALNGIANALVARLIFTLCSLRLRLIKTSYSELIYNLLAFFVLFPALLILAIDSRNDFAVTDRHIKTSLTHESQQIAQFLKTWENDRKSAISNLAKLAASRSPQQMQTIIEQAMKSNSNFMRIGLLDSGATTMAIYPLLDEKGQSNIGREFADRPYIPALQQKPVPMLSEIFISRINTPGPTVSVLAPVVIKDVYAGYVIGALDLEQLRQYLNASAHENAMLYTLIDKGGNVIMTNRADQKVMTPFLRDIGTFAPLGQGIRQWVPVLHGNTPGTERWKQSIYLNEISIGELGEWQLVLEQPIAKFQEAIYKSFTSKLTILFIIFLGGLALAEYLSRRLVFTLSELRMLSLGLPARLAKDPDEILWPQSRIIEADDLINNFKEMAASLTEQFNEIRQLNESLEERVEERTNELQLSRDEWKNTFDCLPDIIAILDLDHHIVHANKAMLAVMELCGKECHLDQPCHKVFHNLDEPPSYCPHSLMLIDNQEHKAEVYEPLLDMHMLITDTPLHNAAGELIGSIHVVRDISAYISIEKDLATLFKEVETRNKFVESIITNLQSGIIVVDLDFRIKLANNYVISLCGLVENTYIGKHLADISPELFANVQEGIIINELVVSFCGMQAVIGYNRVDLANPEGRIIGYIINLKDLTEIVRIRKELRQKERLSAMGEALARVAHEMRNPLFGMTSAAQILEMELKLEPDQKVLMDSLLNESHRLNTIIEELLDTTREPRIKKSSVNLIDILDESLRTVEPLLKEKKVSLSKKYSGKVCLKADFNKLEQVFINIVTNALEASGPDGSINCDIGFTEDEVAVTVTDNGEGILPENLDRIFDVFFTTKKNGTGLGLPICKAIVEAHGGSLTAGNHPQGGAQFVIQLPLGGCPA